MTKENSRIKNEVAESLDLGDDENLQKWERNLEKTEPRGRIFKEVNQELTKQGNKCEKNCF